MKWALVHEDDPASQLAAINALLLLHGVVIQHSIDSLLNRMAATRAETSRLFDEIDVFYS